MGLTVSRQTAKNLTVNRQPSKKRKFYRQPSKKQLWLAVKWFQGLSNLSISAAYRRIAALALK